MPLSRFRRPLVCTLASLFAILIPYALRAQVEPSPESPGIKPAESSVYYGIGLNASLLSGAGLSGRAVFSNGFAIQLTSFVIALGDLTHFNMGLEGQYTFTQGKVGRLYGLVGGGYYLSTRSDTAKPGNRVAEPVRLGIGVGGDLYAIGDLAVDGSLTFHWFVATGTVLPLPSIGLHYYFR